MPRTRVISYSPVGRGDLMIDGTVSSGITSRSSLIANAGTNRSYQPHQQNTIINLYQSSSLVIDAKVSLRSFKNLNMAIGISGFDSIQCIAKNPMYQLLLYQ